MFSFVSSTYLSSSRFFRGINSLFTASFFEAAFLASALARVPFLAASSAALVWKLVAAHLSNCNRATPAKRKEMLLKEKK